MSRILTLIIAAMFAAVASVHAAPLIRGAALFESLSMEGVSLAMSPRDAFDLLHANGYTSGAITSYEDWGEGSLNLVRGSYGGPEGYSSITLGRADDRLALISESLNRPGIDVGAEISSVQSHFGIGADEVDCRLNTAGTGGSCAVRDAEEPDAVTMKFTMTAQSMMILRSVSRPKELKKTLE